MSPFRIVGLVIALLAVVCVVLSLTAWGDPFFVEGAYFNRSVGAPAPALAFNDARPHYILRGAAIGLGAAAVLVLAVDAWARRRAA